MRILLLEPNRLLAETYTKALEIDGHAVVQATTAQQAIDLVDQQTPELVILELQLAEHNGIEFLHEFRSYAEWQAIPVIIHTAVTPARIDAVADVLHHEFGVATILYKPHTTLQQLLRAARDTALAL